MVILLRVGFLAFCAVRDFPYFELALGLSFFVQVFVQVAMLDTQFTCLLRKSAITSQISYGVLISFSFYGTPNANPPTPQLLTA